MRILPVTLEVDTRQGIALQDVTADIRWILARLRHQQFFSLTAPNEAIAALLDALRALALVSYSVS